MKDSYFSRTPKIRTQAEMAEVLAARTNQLPTARMANGERVGCDIPETTHANLIPATAPNRTDSQNAVRQSLEWDEPVRHGDDSGYQLSTDACWSVMKERLSATEWIYRVFKRAPRHLVASAKTAQAAREAAQRYADEHPGG